jgi:hypothetical protein
MSDQKEQTVGDVLFDRVYMPVFMRKIAAANIPVNSDADVQHLLEIAARLRTKSAAVDSSNSMIKAAAAGLRQIDTQEQPAEDVVGTLVKIARGDESVNSALDAMFAQPAEVAAK